MACRAASPGVRSSPFLAAIVIGAVGVAAAAGPRPDAPPGPEPSTCLGRIDARRSDVAFDVLFRLPLHLRGRFARLEGESSPSGTGCRVRVVVDTRSLLVDGPEWMDRLARSSSFLDVEGHPEAVFVSDAFPPSRLNAGGALSGRLRLRGRERPVDFVALPPDCRPVGTPACPLRVQGDIPRRDFGMTSHRTTVRDPVRFAFTIVFDEPSP